MTVADAHLEQDQRQRLRRAILRLTLERGPRAFSQQDLADEVGVSLSTLNRNSSRAEMMRDFWEWCWDTLTAELADRMFEEVDPANGALDELLRAFDYVWETCRDAEKRDLAFLCWLYYRRQGELLPEGGVNIAQERFERRIGGLCRRVVQEEIATDVDPEVLLACAMNYCAATLMSWTYFPKTVNTLTPMLARIGLERMLDLALKGYDNIQQTPR